MGSAKPNNLAKIVVVSLVFALGFITLASALYIEFHYSAVMPHHPQPETGRIYPKWFKSGGTVYLNRRELELSDFVQYRLFPACGIGALLCFGIGARLGWWNLSPKGKYSRF